MTRYQIYLNPDSVEVADRMAQTLGVSRSQILRDVIDRVAREYEKVLNAVNLAKTKQGSILKMSGIIKGGSSDLSSRVDEIYSLDRP